MKANILWIAGLLPLAVACNTDSEYALDKIVPQEYHKVLSLNPIGKHDLTILATGEENETFDYSFIINKNGSDPNTTADVTLTTLTDEELNDEYSTPENVNYKTIPANTFTLEPVEFSFAPGVHYQNANVKFHVEALKKALATDNSVTWVLPLKLVSESDSISADNNELFIRILDVLQPQFGFTLVPENMNLAYSSSLTSASVKIPFGLDMSNRWEPISIQFEATADNVATYNAKNGTYFELVPQGAYNMTSKAELAVGAQYGELPVSFDLSKLNAGERYLLPVTMTEVSKFSVNPSTGVYPLTIVKTPTTADRLDRTGWSATADSEEPKEEEWDRLGYSGLASAAIDGNTTSYWHTGYASGYAGYDVPMPHWLQIDMQSEHTVTAVGLLLRQRTDKNTDDKAGYIEVSQDGTSWTKAGTFEFPNNTYRDELIVYLNGAFKARYLKIWVTEGFDTALNCYCNLAEVYPYGK